LENGNICGSYPEGGKKSRLNDPPLFWQRDSLGSIPGSEEKAGWFFDGRREGDCSGIVRASGGVDKPRATMPVYLPSTILLLFFIPGYTKFEFNNNTPCNHSIFLYGIIKN
jgi:hypothetical protein